MLGIHTGQPDMLLNNFLEHWPDLAAATADDPMPPHNLARLWRGELDGVADKWRKPQGISPVEDLGPSVLYEQLSYLLGRTLCDPGLTLDIPYVIAGQREVEFYEELAAKLECQPVVLWKRRERIAFARRASLARERRRDLAVALFRAFLDPGTFVANSTADKQALDDRLLAFWLLVVGLVLRPFKVPALLLEGDKLEKTGICGLGVLYRTEVEALRVRFDDEGEKRKTLDSLRDLLSNGPNLTKRVSRIIGAHGVLLSAGSALHDYTDEAEKWLLAAAEVAEAGMTLRTAHAMFAVPGDLGQFVDVVIAVRERQPGADQHAGPLKGLDAVVTNALSAVCHVYKDLPERYEVRAWLHDFPGGAWPGVLDRESIERQESGMTIDSAGLPIAIALVSALTGRPMRPDTVSTGAVTGDGSVGDVPQRIEDKVRGLFGWLKPSELDKDAALTFAHGLVPARDHQAALKAAGEHARGRIHAVTDLRVGVIENYGVDSPLLDLPLMAYVESLLESHEAQIPAALADNSAKAMVEALQAVDYRSGPNRTIVCLPWWLPRADRDATDYAFPLVFIQARWSRDALLKHLAVSARDNQLSRVPIYLQPSDGATLQLNPGWLEESVWHALNMKSTVSSGRPEIALATVRDHLTSGRFIFVIEADRLERRATDTILEQSAPARYPGCRWIFLAHATRCGDTTHLVHDQLREADYTCIDLIQMLSGQNSSIWDGYLQQKMRLLVERMNLLKQPGVLQTGTVNSYEERHLTAAGHAALKSFFGFGADGSKGTHIMRTLGAPSLPHAPDEPGESDTSGHAERGIRRVIQCTGKVPLELGACTQWPRQDDGGALSPLCLASRPSSTRW